MSVETRLARRLQRRQAPLPPHGVRARYQLGCGCLPCRLANAEAKALNARMKRRGQIRRRALVRGLQARAWVRALLSEGFTKMAIARALGKKRFRGVGATVTYQRHAALGRLYQTRVADGPCVTESPAPLESRAD